MKKQEEDWELSNANDNIVINDEMRGAEQFARQQNFKNRLINQMNENDDRRKGENNKREQEDALFRVKMREDLERENNQLIDINNQKRKLFLDDVQRQLEDKERVKNRNRELSEIEDLDLKRKA